MERIAIELVAADVAVYASIFQDVSNAAFLQSQLVARNPAFEYAFVDASTIISRKHLLAAVFNAVTALADGSLRTPNVHSEIVYSLSPNHNIAEAYRRFGITPDTRNVVVVKVLVLGDQASHGRMREHVLEHVLGKEVPLTDELVERGTDLGRVTKYYKLGGATKSAEARGPRRSDMELHALAAMALRGL